MDRSKWQNKLTELASGTRGKLVVAGTVTAVIAAGAGFAVAKKGSSSHAAHAEVAQDEREDAHGEAKHEEHAEAHGDAKHEEHADAHGEAKPVGHAAAHGQAHREVASEPAEKPSLLARWMERYREAWDSYERRMERMRKADEEVESLRLENANLRAKLEGVQFDCRAREAAVKTKDIELRLSDETWAMAGRSLDTIVYEIPPHLLPAQLYTLAVSYFKNADFEKSAKIMTRLTGMEESDAFKTPQNILMTGVLWYRLDNYRLADKYFDKVLQFASTKENDPYKAQARLWRALVAERLEKHGQSQRWLVELLDKHPLSTEAKWVNAKEVKRARVPASGTDGPKHD